MESTRKAALAKGEKQYFTGEACVKGHIANRRAKTGECIACRSEHLIEWRKSNPQRVKQHNQTQYQNHANALKERSRKNHWADVDKNRAKQREYQKHNLHVFAKAKAKRKAAELHRTPAWLTEDDYWLMEQAYELATLRTRMLGVVFHVDHILPLQGKHVSGLHVPYNLQVITAIENRAKSNKFEPVT